MNEATTQRDPLLWPKDVANFVGKPVRTLAQWRYLGTGPAYIKVGKHVRYRRSDVDAWLDAQTRTAGGS